MKNSYKFKRNIEIGSLTAENDAFLLKTFVEKPELKLLQEVNESKCIILGRTGIGKSALIKYLEAHENHLVRIEPEAMSLRHLSNSNIISYFKALDIKLDLFYKVLWKHVFIVELIKLHFGDDHTRTSNILDWFKEQFRNDKRKKKAIDYLEKWEHHFWENTEHRIKEIEDVLENNFKSSIGGDADLYELFKASGEISFEKSNSKNIKTELLHKAQKVVNEIQIEEIKDLMSILAEELFNHTQKKYFIIIDDLDKDWVDSSIVYDLIKALINTVNEFRQIKQTKIVVALRTNILRKSLFQNITRGIQREKYNHLYIDLDWTEEELEKLLNNRIKELMRGTYTTESPTIGDILPEASGKSISGFQYIVERTLMRPRDVIDFFNKCIKHADGKTKITREILKKAEDEYSHERLRALNDEWQENYGSLYVIYSFLKGGAHSFKLGEVVDIAKESFIGLMSANEHLNLSDDLKASFEKFGEDFNERNLLERILVILYEVGMLGIKLSPEQPIDYINTAYSSFRPEDIREDSKFYIHKMFYKSLRII
jgi:hypothetical protein